MILSYSLKTSLPDLSKSSHFMMKRHALALLATASLALAQSLSDLPSCAIPCLNDAIKQTSTCATTDLACICKKFDKIQGAAAGCILGACGKDVALGNYVLPGGGISLFMHKNSALKGQLMSVNADKDWQAKFFPSLNSCAQSKVAVVRSILFHSQATRCRFFHSL